MKQIVKVIFVLSVIATAVSGAEYFVATDGDDANDGTKEGPFRTIQKAADVMASGDTCFVREGTYRETVELRKSGEEGRPIRFAAYPGELVTFNGTEPIKGTWSRYKGKIYTTKVDKDFIQLFVDGKMMMEARWPNATLDDLWNPKNWACAGKGSEYGKMVDPALAKTGVDWTGALATLNVGSQFYTWTQTVRSHSKRSDTFEYDQTLPEVQAVDRPSLWEDDRYYLSGKLEALDSAGEWFLDTENNTLYLWAPDGKDPSSHTIEAKVREHAFLATRRDYLEIIGFHFFATTFTFQRCNHCTADNCHLLFPTYASKLGNQDDIKKQVTSTGMSGSHNTVKNSSLAFSPTTGFSLSGQHSTIVNNVVHDVCWNGSPSFTGIAISGRDKDSPSGCIVSNNTVFNSGNNCIKVSGMPAIIVEYNYVHRGGLANRSVSLLYTLMPYSKETQIRYNWAHNCTGWDDTGKGIRADDMARGLLVHHNVIWDCPGGAITLTGDGHRVCNNTSLNNGKIDIAIPCGPGPEMLVFPGYPRLEQQNANSVAINNCAAVIARQRGDDPPLGTVENNYTGTRPKLADPKKLDFRPKPGSPLIDKGEEIPGITDEYAGKSPDIGAYDYRGEYWVPGYRNGLWMSAKDVDGTTIELHIALAMPPLGPITVRVESPTSGARITAGKALKFTPGDWMRPQTVMVSGSGREDEPLMLDFASYELGKAGPVDVKNIDPVWGAKCSFDGTETGGR